MRHAFRLEISSLPRLPEPGVLQQLLCSAGASVGECHDIDIGLMQAAKSRIGTRMWGKLGEAVENSNDLLRISRRAILRKEAQQSGRRDLAERPVDIRGVKCKAVPQDMREP